ncbi:FRIGIDA-like protein 5 [Solanum tuberosum]|uniref:FRIGIDA-like protein 5 n=1 Tax=Solanum tuberosum TaxID=4113 RepID=UPI0003D25CB5|nr:PREDICTED: FRIGIDA-like protein 5 [Solanum tuberosum]XP_015167264.1 PREDICTED: FRIGIDA-like protein 5 [Solanum tuberosum]
MAVLEKISEVMQKNELVKKGIRKSMLMLMQEWKSFEEDSDLTTKCFQQCFNELEVREKHLSSVQESVVDSSQKLNLIRESVEQKRKEVEGKMEEFCAFRDREIRDLERKWKDFILAKQEFDETVKLREKKLNEQEKMGERLLGKIKFEHKQLENKLELQELKSNLLKERLQLREGNRQLSEELDSMKKKLDLVNGELQQEKEKTQTEQGLFKKRMKEIALNEIQVEVMEDRFKFKVLEETKKQLKTIGNAPEKTEAIDNVEVDRVYTTSTDSADIKLVLTMDGKALQIFLNEHEKKPDSMSDDVFRSLHLSRNPAMLVLDAMEGFYPPHLTMMKGDTEFEGTVVRKTCILVLEQLIRFSPKIQPTVRKRAMKLASEWKFKMTGDQLEILGFLYLLASYNLASDFDADELLNLLAVVAEHNKSSELCDLLGLTKKIPCFIQNLIAKQKHLKAVKFAYAFVLADSFRPIPILKDDLKQTIQISDSHCYADVCSVKEKNESIEQSVASIRAVIKCIMDHDLQSQYPPSQLEEYIESLTRQKTHVTTSIISEAQKPQQTQLKHMESTNPSVPADTKALSYTSSVGKASTCMLGHSDAMTSILVSMGGKNLQSFLNNHWKEQGLLRIEISSALKLSSDSGMLVLEALEGFYPPEPHSEEILLDLSVIRKSCILLLEQLMILSPKLKPEAKLEARKLAFDWKAKMKTETENHLAILGFLLLVGAYGLASAFNKDELESLCHTAAQDDNAYQICHELSVAGERPQIERSIDPSKTEPLFNNVEMKGRECDLISGCSLSFIHCVSDPAKLVLDALQKCRSANLGKYKYDPLVMKSFSDLLEHLRDVSPEITPQVKVEALVLSVEWHETLTGSQLNPSEVLRFLQLIATFELSSSYDSDELLGLLEIVYKSRRAINLFKILGLRDKVPCFIEKLIMRKQWLLAIRYIYVYKRVHLFPPVPLLKDYVLNAEELAKKIHDEGLGSREAKEKAINREISALRAAIKCILRHSLQSEYSPDLLRARIAKLQRQMADLRIPNQHSGKDRDVGILCAPISLAAAKKRLASATEGVTVHESQQQQRKLKRFCQLPTQTEVGQESIICNASLSSDVQSSSQPTSADAQSPNYSKDVFSQPSDDQICDSGQPSSQLIGSSHAYDDAKVETREPDLPVQASCHAADSGKLRSHSDHSVIDYSVPQSLSPQIDPFYHPGGNLMPNLQELLNKLMNSLPSSGKSEIGPSKKS